MPRKGRPSKLTPKVQERIVEAIKVGATYKLAAQFGGVDYNTFNEWIKKADIPGKNPAYRDFRDAIKEAEGFAVVEWLGKIEDAAAESWQAAAWKLERRYPESYGRQIQDQRHSGEITTRVKIYLPDEEADGDSN